MGEPAPLDVENALTTLKRALSLQYRSALRYTLVAGSATGVEWQAMGEQLWRFAEAELDDVRRLIEKIVALGGEPDAAPAELPYEQSMEKAFSRLIDEETEAVATLHAIIPHTGQEPRSEALEHRVEHLIMRKQEQLDTLRRALRRHSDT